MTNRDRESGISLKRARTIWRMEDAFRNTLQANGHVSHIECGCPQRADQPYSLNDLECAMDRLNITPGRQGLGYRSLV